MHRNARDFAILSKFCRMFCKTAPSRNYVAGSERVRGVAKISMNLGNSTSRSRNDGIAIGVTVERDRVGRDGIRLVTARKQSSASSDSSASDDFRSSHACGLADDSPAADNETDSMYGRTGGEKPWKSQGADDADDTDDVLRPKSIAKMIRDEPKTSCPMGLASPKASLGAFDEVKRYRGFVAKGCKRILGMRRHQSLTFLESRFIMMIADRFSGRTQFMYLPAFGSAA